VWKKVPVVGSLGSAGSPERWLLPAAVLGWLAIALLSSQGIAMCTASDASQRPAPYFIASYLTAHLAMTLLMLPLVANTLRHVRRRSFEWRRRRSILMAVTGYFCVWLVGNTVLSSTILGLQGAGMTGGALAIVSLILAAFWQLTPGKRLMLNACHRQFPLEATGFRADISCLRQGASNGVYCFASCSFMMLAAMLSLYPTLALTSILLLICFERYDRRGPRRETAYALLGAAVITATCLS
jgi:hypothetical protein